MKPFSSFQTALVVEDLGNSTFKLRSPLVFFHAEDPTGIYVVPEGFITDFASIPRGLWNIVPKIGPYDRAATLHDAGYKLALLTESGGRIHATKPTVDLLFYNAMKADGVGSTRAWLMYHMVKLFGRGDFAKLFGMLLAG